MVVAAVLALNKHQDISNNHANSSSFVWNDKQYSGELWR